MKNLLLKHPELIPPGCFPENDYPGYDRNGSTAICVCCNKRTVLQKYNHRIFTVGNPTKGQYERYVVCFPCWEMAPASIHTEEPMTLREIDDIRGAIVELAHRIDRIEKGN